MTVQQIIDQALYESHLKEAQVDPNQLIGWFNAVRKDIARTIVSDVNENFFFEIWIRDLIADQPNGEYPYPTADGSTKGLSKLIGVSVKPSPTAIKYIKAREVDITSMSADWDYHLENQPKDEPIYFIADKSIFLAPQYSADDLSSPSSNKQLKLFGVSKVETLVKTDDEAKILIPEEHHPLIALGMQYHLFKSRGKLNDARTVMADYQMGKLDMIDKLTNRDISAFTASTPDDVSLQY